MRNIKLRTLIEDKHELLTSKKIKLTEEYAFTNPMRIYDIEEIEARLERLNIPYVLAEIETTFNDPPRYKRGYVLFTEKLKNILRIHFADGTFEKVEVANLGTIGNTYNGKFITRIEYL